MKNLDDDLVVGKFFTKVLLKPAVEGSGVAADGWSSH